MRKFAQNMQKIMSVKLNDGLNLSDANVEAE